MIKPRKLEECDLFSNPFALLGATPRDGRGRIIELAEEKALNSPEDICRKAQSVLLNPKTRLHAELAWFPNETPKEVAKWLRILKNEPLSILNNTTTEYIESHFYLYLTGLNLMASAFSVIAYQDDPAKVAGFIVAMSQIYEELKGEESYIMDAINEDRALAGFPLLGEAEQLVEPLAERRKYYLQVIKGALDRMPPANLVAAMALAVGQATCEGEEQAPALLDKLVDGYEVETVEFLAAEGRNLEKLIAMVRQVAPAGEAAVAPLIGKLEAVGRNWDSVAQPIQFSAKARGLRHEPSHDLAHSLRQLALYLFNEYNFLAQSQKLTSLILELFAELPEVVERVEDDARILAEIFEKRQKK